MGVMHSAGMEEIVYAISNWWRDFLLCMIG